VKESTLSKIQHKESMLFVFETFSKSAGRPMSDEEFFTVMKNNEVPTTQEEVTKYINGLLKTGGFVLSRTKVSDAAGKRMVRQTGIKASVPDGVNLSELKQMEEVELVDNLATVLSVRLGTSLRRQAKIELDPNVLHKLLSESLHYIRTSGGVGLTAMKFLSEEHPNE
jgi:hypothetical protein